MNFNSGYGGGYMERDEVVEYKERNDSDDEFDEVKMEITMLDLLVEFIFKQ